MARDQRSAKNIFVKPRQQMRFAVIFFAAGSAMLSFYIVFVLTSLMSSVTAIVLQYNLPPEILPALLKSIQESAAFVAIFGVLLTIAMLAMGVTVSHRIFGPQIPLSNLVSKLKEGDYTARAQLRKNDEFKELMSDLNELAETLQSKYT